MSVTASTAKTGIDYRVPRRTPILRGVVFTFPLRPAEIHRRLIQKAGNVTCREAAILMRLDDGYILAHRYRWGHKAEDGQRYVSRQLVALPPDLQLKPMATRRSK